MFSRAGLFRTEQEQQKRRDQRVASLAVVVVVVAVETVAGVLSRRLLIDLRTGSTPTRTYCTHGHRTTTKESAANFFWREKQLIFAAFMDLFVAKIQKIQEKKSA